MDMVFTLFKPFRYPTFADLPLMEIRLQRLCQIEYEFYLIVFNSFFMKRSIEETGKSRSGRKKRQRISAWIGDGNNSDFLFITLKLFSDSDLRARSKAGSPQAGAPS